jgi:hypothetical protein
MSTTLTIQNTYYDALFYATATINEYKEFHLTPAEFRLLQKLIHYSSNQINITWSSENISKHIFTTPTAIDKLIERLKKKGYINVSTIQKFEKVKHRTMFINWERIEAVNQLAVEYSNENFTAEIDETPVIEIAVEITPLLSPEEIIVEDDEPILGVYPEQDNEFTKMFQTSEQVIEISEPVKVEPTPRYIPKSRYKTNELIDLNKVMTELSFSPADTMKVIEDLKSSTVVFNDFIEYTCKCRNESKQVGYKGVQLVPAIMSNVKEMIAF